MKEEYWPRLLKDNKKVHFLRTDFDKVSSKYCLEATIRVAIHICLTIYIQWVDEDEQDAAPDDDLPGMGGMGGGMPGMEGMGADGGFGGIGKSTPIPN